MCTGGLKPPTPGAISPIQPTRPFGIESFPGPSQLHSTHGIWEVSGFCCPSQKPPWGLCFSRKKSSHWPPLSPWSWASWPERWGPTLGALMAGCQDSPFKAPFLLLLLLLPLRSIWCWERERKNDSLRPKSQSPLSRQASDTSVHT